MNDGATTDPTPSAAGGGYVHGPAKGPGRGGPASGVPARNRGTRPPFTTGNAALTNGAYSPRVYGELARDLAAGLLDRRPDLGAYADTVERWATASAISLLLRRHLDAVGVIDPETDKPRTALLQRIAAEDTRAERTGMLLGLDPSSQARVARDRTATIHLSVDIEAILARGREANAARDAAALPAPDPGTEPDDADPVAAALAGVREEGRAAYERAAAEHAAAAAARTTAPTDHDDGDGDDHDGGTFARSWRSTAAGRRPGSAGEPGWSRRRRRALSSTSSCAAARSGLRGRG